MTEPTQDPRGIERLALLAIVLAMIAVPFVGLIWNAPWYWYPLASGYIWYVSEMGSENGTDSIAMRIASVAGRCWRAVRRAGP